MATSAQTNWLLWFKWLAGSSAQCERRTAAERQVDWSAAWWVMWQTAGRILCYVYTAVRRWQQLTYKKKIYILEILIFQFVCRCISVCVYVCACLNPANWVFIYALQLAAYNHPSTHAPKLHRNPCRSPFDWHCWLLLGGIWSVARRPRKLCAYWRVSVRLTYITVAACHNCG